MKARKLHPFDSKFLKNRRNQTYDPDCKYKAGTAPNSNMTETSHRIFTTT
jgi:hypothetical protein